MLEWNLFVGKADEWDLIQFELGNSNFYQSYVWGEFKKKEGWKPVRILMRNNSRIHASAQILVKKKIISFIWVPGGIISMMPNWSECFQNFIKKTYPIHYCRTNQLENLVGFPKKDWNEKGWFEPGRLLTSGYSMVLNLTNSEEDVLKNMSPNWRHNLKRANKNKLTISLWQNPDVSEIAELYLEMEEMKKINVQQEKSSLDNLINVLKEKLIIFQCRDEFGKLLSIRGVGIFGDSVWDLLAATSNQGRKLYSAYRNFWEVALYCKNLGIQRYDLGGVDPINSVGVYNFKKGTGAKLVQYVGEWDRANIPFLRFLINNLMKFKKI